MVVISLVSMVFGELMEHQKAGNAVAAKTFWVLQRSCLYCKRYVFICLSVYDIFRSNKQNFDHLGERKKA